MRKKMQKRPKGSHPLHRFEKGKKKQKMAKGTHPHHRQHRQRPRRRHPHADASAPDRPHTPIPRPNMRLHSLQRQREPQPSQIPPHMFRHPILVLIHSSHRHLRATSLPTITRRSSPPVTYAPIHPLPPHPVQLHPKIKQKRKKRQSTPKPSPKIKKKQKKQANRPRFQHHAESSRRSLETAKGGNVTSSEKSFEKNKGKR